MFPQMQYCMCVWGSCTKTQKRRLQKCINFAVRIVTGLGSRERVSGVLRDLGWRAIDVMIAERDLYAMYKFIHGIDAPELLCSRIVSRSDVAARSTRATDDGQLEIPRSRTEFGRRCFFSRAVRAWNELPLHMRSSSSMCYS